MKKTEKLHRRIYFYFLHIANNQVSTKLVAKLSNFAQWGGGPFTPPPLWGVSNEPKTLIFFPRGEPLPNDQIAL